MQHPHSPEELAALSTFAHNLIGWLLLLASALMARELFAQRPPSPRWQYVAPTIGVLIGLSLAGYLLVHFILWHRVSPFASAAQNQHQLIGLVTALGSALEIARRRRASASRLWAATWPLTLVVIGAIFAAHHQTSFQLLIVHWFLGGTLITSGLALVAAALTGDRRQPLALFGSFLLITASVELIVYEEAPSAAPAPTGHANASGTETKPDQHIRSRESQQGHDVDADVETARTPHRP